MIPLVSPRFPRFLSIYPIPPCISSRWHLFSLAVSWGCPYTAWWARGKRWVWCNWNVSTPNSIELSLCGDKKIGEWNMIRNWWDYRNPGHIYWAEGKRRRTERLKNGGKKRRRKEEKEEKEENKTQVGKKYDAQIQYKTKKLKNRLKWNERKNELT